MLIGVTISVIAILIITALFILAMSIIFVKAHSSNFLIEEFMRDNLFSI